ncbi:hypothetical protein GQ53DRAFT_828214 [Thozetella sp. PMI_491]|nr:hypothetical protein GQ53DRAFT_828214 [Thozetella sp. PMI_491]
MTWFKSTLASQKERLYNPLTEDRESDDENYVPPRIPNKSPLTWSFVLNFILALLVVGLTTRILSQPTGSPAVSRVDDVLPFSIRDDYYGISSKVLKTYSFLEDDFDDDNFTKSDPYWEALFPLGGGQLLLEDQVVAAYKLPPTLRVPEKGNQSAYMIAGYHSLHCVTAIRTMLAKFMEAHRTGTKLDMTDDWWEHTMHCLADLRQLVLCSMDETLYVISDVIHPGYHQKKVCKDLGPIDKWLEYNFEGKFT